MLKKELIKEFATKSEITQKAAEQYLTDLLEVIMDGVAKDGEVIITGFGKFEKKPVKGREGTIQFGDRKGQEWATEDSFKCVFKVGKIFDDKVKGVYVEE
jgi:DNA-binding protein HU-beta